MHSQDTQSKDDLESNISFIYAVDSNPSSGDFLFHRCVGLHESCRKESSLQASCADSTIWRACETTTKMLLLC